MEILSIRRVVRKSVKSRKKSNHLLDSWQGWLIAKGGLCKKMRTVQERGLPVFVSRICVIQYEVMQSEILKTMHLLPPPLSQFSAMLIRNLV